MSKCTVDECVNPAKVKGLCNAHYIRKQRRWTTDRYVHVPIFKKCWVTSCELKVKAHWYCTLHYERLLCWRTIDAPIRTTHRPAIIEWDIAKIPIWMWAKDWYAIVDREFAYLDKHKWVLWQYYAQTKVNWKPTPMHIMIKGKAPKWFVTDHINRDKLDNRLCNLRHCSYSLNTVNKWLQRNNTTWCKGVYLHKATWHYYVVIRRNHVLYHIW